MAELVLRQYSADPGRGGRRMAAFVVNAAMVFEDFVTRAVREALRRRPGRTESQYRRHFDGERTIPIRPDVVHVEAEGPVAVFDAKYKLEGPVADAYQMRAYCTALSLTTGWLIYARGTPDALHRYIRNTDINIVQHSLDLDTDPADLLRQVADLAGRALIKVC
ncbi:McrC family protein [Actinoplanes sp. ATCC 53533]|uniref:McrC family protein n=1 Tax=Actinoplanes sp. ATCC 53533 TaxID=1288362 RepID=UPI002104B293|nr:McrC family protein [Actinoplanes sp. ATCC 53533]